MNKYSKNSIKYITAIAVIFIIIIITIWYYFNRNDFFKGGKDETNKYNKDPLYTKNPKCKKNEPLTDKNGNIFKVYNDYSDIRNFNKTIQKQSTHNDKNQDIGPKNIFIMRHAERDPTLYNLDQNGIYKSSMYPHIINSLNKEGYNIDGIITCNPNGNSIHVQQTVTLSSWILNIPLFIFGSQKEIDETVDSIYTTDEINNKNIIIVWEHSCIQDLMMKIIEKGVKVRNIKNYKFINPIGNSKLPYWHSNNFKSIYHIDDKLQLNILNEGVKTCNGNETSKITWGKSQNCHAI